MMGIFAGVALAVGGSTELLIVLKATVVVALALVGARLARGTRASVRHLVLASAFGVLLVFPVAAVLMPPVVVKIPIAHVTSLTGALTVQLDNGIENVAGTTGTVHPSDTVKSRWASVSASTLLRTGWAIGATLFLIPLAAALAHLRRVRRGGLPWRASDPLVRRLCSEAGIRRPVDIFLHEDILTPMTCGLVRPAIVMPSDAREWSEADVRQAVVHELEHVHRADWLVHLAARLVCALYWFHPLAWTAWRRLCLESERACDDVVLQGADRTAYAEQLVMLARRLVQGGARPVLSMTNRSDLSTRVSAVLDGHQARGRAGRLSAVAIGATAVVLALAISPLRAVGQSGERFVPIATNHAAPLAVSLASALQPRVEPATSPSSMSQGLFSKPTIPLQARPPQAPSVATDASAPVFDVASVKPTKISGSAYYFFHPGGRFTATNFPLKGLITRAYRLQSNQVEGGPSWVSSDGFDIEAKAEGNPPPEQVLLMVRALLAERFKLKLRTETRQLPIYALELARSDGKLGSGLRPASPADCVSVPPSGGPPSLFDRNHPPCGALYSPIGHWTGRGVSIETLTSDLSRVVSRVVLNRTRLTGRFDLDLQWTDLTVLLQPGGSVPDAPPPADNPASIYTALQEQLGLKLDSQKGPVVVLVIDRAEKPTDN
jgi:bla regulator protein BlaR1